MKALTSVIVSCLLLLCAPEAQGRRKRHGASRTISLIGALEDHGSIQPKLKKKRKRKARKTFEWVDNCPPCPECEGPVAVCEDVPVCDEEVSSLVGTAVDPLPPPYIECPELPPPPQACPEPSPQECAEPPIIVIEDKPQPCFVPPLEVCGTCPDPPSPPVLDCPPAPETDYAQIAVELVRAGEAIPKSWLSRFDCQLLSNLYIRAISRANRDAISVLLQEHSARSCAP